MKRFGVFPALIFFFITLLFPSSVLPTSRGVQVTGRQGNLFLYNDYHALVVGVGNYTNGWPGLPGALKDSEEVAAALQNYGFNVKLVKNPTSRELKKAVTEMAFSTGKEQNRALLFYFAGHGETLNLADGTKLGYIIPSDCPLKDKDPFAFDDLAISMREMEALALKVQSKHVIMMFDSCFSGALFNLVRAAPTEISEKSVTPVRQFITAGEEGEQVPDRSVFKQVFLDGIRSEADLNKDGYVTGSELGMHLQTRVVNYSRGGQHPQYGKINNPRLDKGDFIFVPQSTRRQQDEEVRKAEAERAAVSDELKRLQEERRKNEELMERLKQLLEARVQTEEAQKKRTLDEQKGLEERLRQAEKDRQVSTAEAEERMRRVEAERKATEEKMAREAAERKALEQEVQRLRAESRKTTQAVRDLEVKKVEEVKVASIPKEVPRPEPPKPAQAETGLKLAIFPIHFDPAWREEENRPGYLKHILISLDKSTLFKEVVSYYDIEYRPDINVIGKDRSGGAIWKRKSAFSNLEPDVDLICKEGKELGVDAVVALFVDGEMSAFKMQNARYTAYLIDVARRRTYSHGGTSSPAELAGHDIQKAFQKLLDEFRKDRGILEADGASPTKVAALQKEVGRPAPSKPAPAELGPSLAIFPMLTVPDRIEEGNRSGYLKNIMLAVDKAEIFKQVLSYYEIEFRPDIKVLDRDRGGGGYWTRKSAFSSLEPNVDLICEEGKKLGVDAVFVLFVEVETHTRMGNANLRVYLVDVHARKTYFQGGNFPAQLAGHEMQKAFHKVLEDYSKNRGTR